MVVSMLSHCAEVLGGRYVVVGALSVLEANSPQEVVVVCRTEHSEVLLAGSPSHTPVQQGLQRLGL